MLMYTLSQIKPDTHIMHYYSHCPVIDPETLFLVCILSVSSSYVKVIMSRSRSQEPKIVSVCPVCGWSVFSWKAVLLIQQQYSLRQCAALLCTVLAICLTLQYRVKTNKCRMMQCLLAGSTKSSTYLQGVTLNEDIKWDGYVPEVIFDQ